MFDRGNGAMFNKILKFIPVWIPKQPWLYYAALFSFRLGTDGQSKEFQMLFCCIGPLNWYIHLNLKSEVKNVYLYLVLMMQISRLRKERPTILTNTSVLTGPLLKEDNESAVYAEIMKGFKFIRANYAQACWPPAGFVFGFWRTPYNNDLHQIHWLDIDNPVYLN